MHMFAQVDQWRAVQDYPPYRECVRLVGVEPDSFERQAFNREGGCRTYFFDIPWDQFFASWVGGQPLHWPWHIVRDPWPLSPEDPLEQWPHDLWMKLGYEQSEEEGAYFYEIFGEENVANIAAKSIDVFTGPAVASAPLSTGPAVTQSQIFDLSAFHVGQGMCALLHGSNDGFLFDAGAGTPIKRRAYRNPAPTFRNDLRSKTANLRLQAVISHADSDHWRLLDWDLQLLAATNAIFTPAGTAALGLKSSHAIAKVFSLAGSTTVSNGPGGATLFEAHRSNPSRSDSNGECLVVETYTPCHCLFPGDYVYSRMATDSTSSIRALSSATLDAVVVPHHGDAASANVLVSPRHPNSTIAFFSAGMHPRYQHPRPSSLGAHQNARFRNINNNTLTDIVEQPLP